MSEDGERENTESTDERHERRFRLGGLALELSGVSADIEELALELKPIEAGVSEPADPRRGGNDERDERRSRRSSRRHSVGYGARLGAFLGREIGLFLGRLLDRGVSVLWNRIRTRRGKTDGENVDSVETTPASSSADDSTEFDGELLARLARVANRDRSG